MRTWACFSGSSSRDMGSFFSFSSTVYGSLACTQEASQLAGRTCPHSCHCNWLLPALIVLANRSQLVCTSHRSCAGRHAAAYAAAPAAVTNKYMRVLYNQLRLRALVPISSRKRSSWVCPITRVLPNQRLSGWMRVLGSSLLCRSCGCKRQLSASYDFALQIVCVS